ncbi:MAG: VWA domain-containing protein [Deltaproteobacteria bacterium]|nr:VWA domain-containing protein [Deltaproteobacteria bacterium]
MEFRFENPIALFGLGFVLVYLGRCLWKRKYLKDSFLWRRTLLNSLGLIFCVFGLSRPQGGEAVTSQVSERANLFIAIDISQSMLAQDTLPSRIRFAIDFSQKLLDQLNQVKVALYPFALDGYIQMPLSSDFQAAKDLLSSMTPSMATGQGTDLSAILENLLTQIYKNERIAKERGSDWVKPQILLLSDGETHVPIKDAVLAQFKKNEIPIFTVGVGGTQSVAIPLENRFGRKLLLRDSDGKTVLTQAHPDVLQKISQITGGVFYQDSFQEVPKLVTRLNQAMQLGKLATGFRSTREFYPLCFMMSFFLILIEFSKARWEFALRTLLFLFLLGKSSQAIEPFENETAAVEHYNRGVQAYRNDNLKESADELEKSIFSSLDPKVRKRALFNLGNVYLKMGEIEQALQAYQQSHDTQTSNTTFDKETNQKISDNLALLERMNQEKQKRNSKEPREGEGEGKGKKNGAGSDPKGPKKFEDEGLSEEMKQKVYDHISDEERETLKRLSEEKNKNSANRKVKPW